MWFLCLDRTTHCFVSHNETRVSCWNKIVEHWKMSSSQKQTQPHDTNKEHGQKDFNLEGKVKN